MKSANLLWYDVTWRKCIIVKRLKGCVATTQIKFIFMCDAIAKNMRVGKSDFDDPVCKCSRCRRCSCTLGSERELFTRVGASAMGEGQGRKIRKSWEEGGRLSISRREETGDARWTKCAFLGRENSGSIALKDDYRRVVCWQNMPLLRQMREKYTEKWKNDILVEFIPHCELQCKSHYTGYTRSIQH